MQSTRRPNNLCFCFELDQIADIQPWGEPGRRGRLHWFGLTSGRYWIDTPLGQVLRYTTEIRKIWNYPFLYVDYQVARFFEDLQDHLPAILESIPEDIARIVSDPVWLTKAATWRDQQVENMESEKRWDLYDSAIAWWHQREIDTAYLSHGPWFSFWRVGNEVCFRWTTRNNMHQGAAVFLVPTGCVEMSAAEFAEAAYGFCQEVLAAMNQRVEEIQRDGWTRDCELDVEALVAEHRSREGRFKDIPNQISTTNWNEVRTHLHLLIDHMGKI
jgi:hypothetical protein